MKHKFILEFDEAPPLVFIQNRAGSDFRLYQDGKIVRGIRNVSVFAHYDSPTTHEIEYLTGKTKGDE